MSRLLNHLYFFLIKLNCIKRLLCAPSGYYGCLCCTYRTDMVCCMSQVHFPYNHRQHMTWWDFIKAYVIPDTLRYCDTLQQALQICGLWYCHFLNANISPNIVYAQGTGKKCQIKLISVSVWASAARFTV